MFMVKSVDPKTYSPPSRNERLVTNEVTTGTSQEHLKASCYYFACLTTALLRQLQFVFCRGKLLTTTETTVT